MRFWLPLLLVVFQPATWAVPVFFTSNRQGEIEPCGCQTGQIGGLDRMANFVAQFGSRAGRLFVDSGDAFFAFPTLHPNRKDDLLRKAELIARSYKEMELQLFTPGELDFAGGIPYLKKLQRWSGAEFLSTNLRRTSGATLFLESKILKVGGIRFGTFSLASPEAFQNVPGIKVLSPKETAKKMVAKLRSKVDVILVLSHLGLSEDRKLKNLGIDLVFGSHSLDAINPPEKVGKTHIFQSYIEGQQIGFVSVDKKGRVKNHKLFDLGPKFDGDNAVKKMMKRFQEGKRALAEKVRAPLAKSKKEKRSFVAHPFHCRSCHTEQYDFWSSTKHASAYLVLYAKNQHFDPECIGCHSIGFEAPGGFQKIAHPIVLKEPKKGVFVETLMKRVFKKDPGKGPLDSRIDPKRYAALHKSYTKEVHALEKKNEIAALHIGVQCEHCHGSRIGHPHDWRRGKGPVAESSCLACHTPPNAKRLGFKKARKLIACPKMG